MTVFTKEMCKRDPKVLGKLFDLVKSKHKPADHTERVLLQHRHVKDFCEEARHFVLMPGAKPLYIHYDVSSWFREPMGVAVRIDSIGVYDDFLEYEKARLGKITEGSQLN